MDLRFRFSWRVTLICGLLIAGMIRASVWQWHRHLEKKEMIGKLDARLEAPVEDLQNHLDERTDWDSLIHKRVNVAGEFDHQNEIVLRNRRLGDVAGVHVLTPLRIDGSSSYVLVDRGFIPLEEAAKEERAIYQQQIQAALVGLIKPATHKRFLAPGDPEAGGDNPWVDAWLRVDIPKIEKQLPYELLPIYLETIPSIDGSIDKSQLIDQSSDRASLLFMPASAAQLVKSNKDEKKYQYPVPVVNTYVPPGRHFGYVFEWAIMALVTLAIAVVLQLRRD